MKKILKKIILSLCVRNFFCFLPDSVYIKMLFRIYIGKKLSLKNPKTLNEKMQWLKLYDRKDIYTIMVDKFEAKKYAADLIGDEYIIPTLGIYDKFEDIDFNSLPNQFVIKCTHDSGGLVIVKDKKQLDYKKVKKKINKSLKRNYYYYYREWPYKNVKPRIIIEELLVPDNNMELNDYKFFIFNNKLAYTFVCSERSKKVKFTFYDKNKKILKIKQCGAEYDENVKLPKNYDKMVELAEKLSTEAIEIRVDFYEVNNKIYFGELTFFDSGGFGKFDPELWDEKLGKLLKLPIDTINNK